jgi:phosphatidylglycerol:prolipoprotein diacylglycerol transferase
MTINVDPVLFSFGPLSVRWYGLMYVVGIAVGFLVAFPYARAKGLTGQQLEKVVLFAIPAGLIGGRLYYVIQQPLGQYVREPWRTIAVWQGGMAFYGAVFAVVVTILVVTWRMKLPLWRLLDVAALGFVVGQFFGRIGNFINGDVIGQPTSLPWGVVYANPDSLAPRHDIAYHPAAAYEALLNVCLFGLLWYLRNRLKPGMLFFVYIFGYSIGQMLIFVWRNNQEILWSLKQAQLTAIGVMIVAAIVLAWLLRKRRKSNQSADPLDNCLMQGDL